MDIRESKSTDLTEILNLHTAAFGTEKGPEIAELVRGLIQDDTAVPRLSLVALEGDRIQGHILFTRAVVAPPFVEVSVQLLAPLAVLPGVQKQGVGGGLIREGLERLKASGVELVFVLGHPDYYPRCGFIPAGAQGFDAPYPIPEVHAGAWMVQALSEGVLGRVRGRIQCAEVLDRPEHWRE